MGILSSFKKLNSNLCIKEEKNINKDARAKVSPKQTRFPKKKVNIIENKYNFYMNLGEVKNISKRLRKKVFLVNEVEG